MSKIIKRIINAAPCVLLRKERVRLMGERAIKNFDDFSFIKMKYEKLGRPLDLRCPRRFTEKLQWLKLFWRQTEMPVCTDKFEVRNYLEARGYGHILNELIAVFDDLSEFNPDKLPNQFVLKATHGSGWNLIVKDKTKINWFWWKKIMRSWMRQNLFYLGREWNYKTLPPRIVAEKYLEDDSGELRDYKVFCMNGKAKFLQLDENRLTNHKRLYVDCDGNPLPMRDSGDYARENNASFGVLQKEMISIAEDLCKPFPMVRVDFYECAQKIYFGELTFFDGSGFYSFSPDEWDFIIGDMLDLPKPNYNLELYSRINEGK